MKRSPSFWLKGLLPIGGLVLGLLSMEAALRIAAVMVRPRFTRVDDTLGWYHTPGASGHRRMEGHDHVLSYNASGFRGQDIPFERTRAPRVVFLGDSFVDGSEVGDREVFSDRLEKHFPCLEVVNLGVYGYSTAQELLAFERVGSRYSPDLVVLVTSSNDFAGNILNFSEFGPAPRFLLAGDSLVFEGTDHPEARRVSRAISLPVPGWRFLHAHSHLYWMVNSRIYQMLRASGIRELERQQLGRYTLEEQQRLYWHLVRRLHDLTRSQRIELVVVFIYQRDELRPDSVSPQAPVIERLRTSGIALLDLYQSFTQALSASHEPLFYERDIHWNAAGHRVFADLVSPVLKETLGRLHPHSCMAAS